jgi:hypothetical protein
MRYLAFIIGETDSSQLARLGTYPRQGVGLADMGFLTARGSPKDL